MPDCSAQLPTLFPSLAQRTRKVLLRAPLFLPLVAVVGAIVGSWGWSVVCLSLLVAVILKLWRFAVAIILCVCIACLQQERHNSQAMQFRRMLDANPIVTLEGTVTRVLNAGCVLNTGWNGVNVVVRDANLSWKEGDYVKLTAEYKKHAPTLLPGMFDAEKWMRQQNIAAQMRLVQGEYIGHPFSWAALTGAASAVRESLSRRLMPPGCEHDARRQVLCALVLGDKSRADDETMLDFRKGGCLHAFAVSGLHVGLVCGILWGVLRLFRVRLSISRPVVLIVSGLYVVMTGFAVPAVRAYVMLAVVLVGSMLRRRVSLLNTWSFAALLILLISPHQLSNAGFQLSFIVYAAICVAARLILSESAWFGPDAYLPYRIRSNAERRCAQWELFLRGVVIVSLCAWLVSLPITMTQFHTLNPLSFLTNIIIAPLLPIVMFAGLSALLLGSVPWLGAFMTHAALISADWLLSLVAFCGAMPVSYLPAHPPQSTDGIVLISTGYGGSACQLGNGGLLIAGGNAQTARFHIEPAIFHAGFRPAALLITPPSKKRAECKDILSATWPNIRIIDTARMTQAIMCLETSAGRFSFVAPPADLPKKTIANASPIVLWEGGKHRVLYVGDASLLTFQSLPHEWRQADILILGYNKKMPLNDAELILSTHASQIILLPSAADMELDEVALASMKLVRMSKTSAVYFID